MKRAAAFEMKILAHDPYVSSLTAADLHVELVDLKTIYQQSDYISLHMALTPETNKLISKEALANMKPGVRIINCARGELIDTAALHEAMASGKVAGRRPGCIRERTAGGGRTHPAAGQPYRDAAHRRIDRRSAGDRRRPNCRADRRVPAARRRAECG